MNATPHDAPPPQGSWTHERVIAWIMWAVLAWGAFHALGAYLYNHNPARPLMVLGCVAAFLGFWRIMLAARARRLRRQSEGD